MALTDYLSTSTTAMPSYASGTTQVVDSLNSILGSNSSYIQNARRAGAQQAAARGGVNSSIAAGASERAALDSASSMVGQATNIDMNAQNVAYQNWLQQNNFSNTLQSSILDNSLSALNSIQRAALEDPELYTDDVVSGYSNFFNQNTADILKNYFGNSSSGSTV